MIKNNNLTRLLANSNAVKFFIRIVSLIVISIFVYITIVSITHYKADKAKSAQIDYAKRRFSFAPITISPAMKYVEFIDPKGQTVAQFAIKPDTTLITDHDDPTMPFNKNGARKEKRIVKFHLASGKYVSWDGTFLLTDKIITSNGPRIQQ